MKKIAILGSTGMLGQPVTQALLNKGYYIKALTSNIARAKKLGFVGDVNFYQGDVRNFSDIEKVIDGVDIVYISLSVSMDSKESDFQPERDGISNILEVAKKKNVKLISYLSGGLISNYFKSDKANWWVFNNIRIAALNKIEKSGLPNIIFKPSFFMENFTGGLKQGSNITLAGKSLYPMYLIAGVDYAKMVVKAFDLFDGKSQTYNIQGPEAYTTREAADLFVQNYKSEQLKVIQAPLVSLKFLGLFRER